MTFKAGNLNGNQWVVSEFFAYLPVKTINGWTWLVDVVEVETFQQDWFKGRWFFRRHYEKLYRGC